MIPISIIIPVYNVEPYIADCLKSVMRQIFMGPLECIVVDDCGTDKSVEVAERMIAEYEGPVKFRIVRHEHNRGLSAARNTGMDAATGEYVYFLDSDDWISDDCIEKLTEPLLQEKVDIVVGDYVSVGSPPCTLKLSLSEGKHHENEFTKTFCNGGVYVMAVNKLYNREFLIKKQLKFEEGRVHEDEILAFELSCVEKSFYVTKAVTYYYRIRENSITTLTSQHEKLLRYAGILHSVKGKVKRYERKEGIYDFYMNWIKRVFVWISKMDLDEDLIPIADEQTRGFLDVIPSLSCLKNKHNRLIYHLCKKKQTYSRYLYVTEVYSNSIQGRVMRNMLKLFPYKSQSNEDFRSCSNI